MEKDIGAETCKLCQGECCKGCHATGGYYALAGSPNNRIQDEQSRLTQEEMRVMLDAKTVILQGSGYQLRHQLLTEFATLVGAKWSPLTGFNSPTGCTIPREKRSWVCRTYMCDKLKKAVNISQSEYLKFWA